MCERSSWSISLSTLSTNVYLVLLLNRFLFWLLCCPFSCYYFKNSISTINAEKSGDILHGKHFPTIQVTVYLRNLFLICMVTHFLLSNPVYALFKIGVISCSLFGYITLHMLMYAANTYYWKRYRVNYPFLFGFRPGTELDHREVFLLTTGHAVVAVLCFLINLQLEMNQNTRSYKTATELVPLSLVVVRCLIYLDNNL